MKILVTGATGYIGERLVRQALLLGHEVIAASRRRPERSIQWIPYELSHPAEVVLPAGIDVIFHLAATMTQRIDLEMELRAAKRLIHAAGQAKAQIVFVSSQVARKDAPTSYGKTKWQIEQEMLAAGARVVRPGLVYGGSERGLFGRLTGAVRGLPVLPGFLPAPKVQPVHVDDLALALLRCVESDRSSPSSVLCVGAPVPLSMTKFLRTIAKVRVRRYRIVVPVPVFPLRFVLMGFGEGLRTRLGIDRLLSLFELPAMRCERDLHSLGISLRTLASGMARAGSDRRRRLIREGYTLLRYVLKCKPSPALARRYVRCIERLRTGLPLHLPGFTLLVPACIALFDAPRASSRSSGSEFLWRLNAAAVLAEASLQGAQRFLLVDARPRWVAWSVGFSHLAHVLSMELMWRLLRGITGPVLGSALRRL